MKKFRSKFEPVVIEEYRSNIEAAFEKFCELSENMALTLLWKLTYEEGEATAREWLGISEEMISHEDVIMLRNELRYQYGGFTSVENSFCKEAFSKLANKSDIIVANVVYNHCKTRQNMEISEIQRLLYLLKSDKEKNYFGGLRILGFKKEESIYLKPFHTEIGALFESVYEASFQNEASNEFSNKPFMNLSNILTTQETVIEEDVKEVAGEQEVPELAVKEVVEEQEGFCPITSEAIICNKSSFESFMQSLEKLEDMGYDPNEAIRKATEIRALLKALDNLKK